LSVFGSVSRGTSGPDSDIDILVRYYKTPGLFDFLSLKKYLETIMGKPVDLVTEGALKKKIKNRNSAGGNPCRIETGNSAWKISMKP
jgi:uncharacterized protein